MGIRIEALAETAGCTLGARVFGVDVRSLDETEWRAVHAAFLEYGLLLFADQALSAAEQADFASRFGTIEVLVQDMTTIPLSNKALAGGTLETDTFQMQLLRGNEGWHTDSSYMPLAAKASVLSAQVVPDAGGETEWADARAAYDALDPALRERIASLNAYHSYLYSQGRMGHEVEAGAGYGFFEGEPPLRSLVKVHPETGRPALYIGRHACRIPGMDEAESEALLDELTAFTCQPPRVYRHRWTVGELALWDNRCLLHRARPYDYQTPRVMMHTRVAGERGSELALNAA